MPTLTPASPNPIQGLPQNDPTSLLPKKLARARPLFVGLLVGTVLIVGALTFFPALSLGPIVEHFLMHSGKLFSIVLLPLWS